MNSAERRWREILEETARYDGQSVLYCFRFKHDVCKVGKSMCLRKRAKQLSSHGLWNQMFVDVIAIPCRPDALSVAERLALSKLAVKLRRLGPEIFESPADIGIAADVLAESIRIAEQLTEPTDLGPADFAAIAAESGIIASMVIDSARQDIEAAISLAMRAPEMSEKEFLWNFDELPPFAAHLVPGMVERNAVLIGLGKPYDERKPALQAFAAVWVAQHAARLEHPA